MLHGHLEALRIIKERRSANIVMCSIQLERASRLCACLERTGKCWAVGNTGSLAVNLYRDGRSLLKADAELGENHMTQKYASVSPTSAHFLLILVKSTRAARLFASVLRRGEDRRREERTGEERTGEERKGQERRGGLLLVHHVFR